MLENKNYANGQKVYELNSDKLTYFFKTGKIKATGPYINGKMEGEWLFTGKPDSSGWLEILKIT